MKKQNKKTNHVIIYKIAKAVCITNLFMFAAGFIFCVCTYAFPGADLWRVALFVLTVIGLVDIPFIYALYECYRLKE